MTGTARDVKAYQWYSAGHWHDAATAKVFDDFEPYTGDLYARVADCGPEETRFAISAAHDAFREWAETTPADRARLFLKAAAIVRRRCTEIAAILARET